MIEEKVEYLKHFSFSDPETQENYDSGWKHAFLDLARESGLLSHLELKKSKVCYIDLNSFSPWLWDHGNDNRNESFQRIFNSNFLTEESTEYKFVISFLGEAKNYLEVTPLLELLEINKVSKDRIHLLHSCKTDYLRGYRHGSFWEFFLRNPFDGLIPTVYLDQSKNLPEYNHRNTEPKKHFLCLMRRARVDRILVINQLAKYDWWENRNVLDLSFGPYGEDDQYILGNYTKYLTPGLEEKLPIKWDTYPVTDNKQHVFLPTSSINQLVNIVVETLVINDGLLYNPLFITEKSVKPFYYYQMPIYIGQRGLVSELRELGYDLFDDYFENHYYDEIKSDYIRIQEALRVADNFYKKFNTETLPTLKTKLLDRLDYNLNIARTFAEGKYTKVFFEKTCTLLQV